MGAGVGSLQYFKIPYVSDPQNMILKNSCCTGYIKKGIFYLVLF